MSKLLTPEQLVERWSGLVTIKTLANWRHIGEGPKYTKLGGKVAYPLDDVELYEKNRTITPEKKLHIK